MRCKMEPICNPLNLCIFNKIIFVESNNDCLIVYEKIKKRFCYFDFALRSWKQKCLLLQGPLHRMGWRHVYTFCEWCTTYEMNIFGHGFNLHCHSAAHAIMNESYASICAVLFLREMTEAYLQFVYSILICPSISGHMTVLDARRL